jgi:hypothetical protein
MGMLAPFLIHAFAQSHPKLLNEYSDHTVHLYESDSRPGGHANTVRFVPPGKEHEDGVDVDTYVFSLCEPIDIL